MSNSFTYRRRTYGRCPSPPTWACYEQIPIDDDSCTGSDDDSCSEDDDDYGARSASDHSSDCDSDDNADETVNNAHDNESRKADSTSPGEVHSDAMDTSDDPSEKVIKGADKSDGATRNGKKKDVKGKQRAVDPEVNDPPKRRERRRKHREPFLNLRPILTIHKSQGFVWNQDLFVPPYSKDRYIASTSPPNASVITSNTMNDYEVDVVEIRIDEGYLQRFIS